MTGAELIADERQRQINVEGWTPEHDDEHGGATLTRAAICYADHAARLLRAGLSTPAWFGVLRPIWPWEPGWWKPSDDPIRNLVKAGALIAAEIDRLRRVTP